jgi:membrane fusion protein (multidrug efflux system)
MDPRRQCGGGRFRSGGGAPPAARQPAKFVDAGSLFYRMGAVRQRAELEVGPVGLALRLAHQPKEADIAATRRGVVQSCLLIAVTVAAVAGGWFAVEAALAPDDENAQDAPSEATRATVAALEARTLRDVARSIGTVLPRRSIEVTPTVAGRVTEVLFAPGERVAENEVLFRLDDAAQRAALAEAEATVRETRDEFSRVEELVARDVQAEATLEAARAAFLRAEARVEAARVALDDRRVTAPFAGVIGLSDLDPGERVDPDTVVATLDDLSEVRIEFPLPERYYDRLRRGQLVVVTGDGFAGPVEARVDVVAPRVTPQTQSFDLWAVARNDDRALVGGMLADVEVVFDEREGLTAPEEAILDQGDETYVFVVEDGRARRKPVELGLRQEGRIEVIGLEPDAAIVVSGLANLSDGDAVEAQGEATGAPADRGGADG